MAFPTIPTSGAGRIISVNNTAGGATKTSPNLSSLTKNAGDLLIAIVVTYDGNSTNAEFSSWGGSFTEFADRATTTTMGIGCAYKWSTGSETGTFTVTTADTSANDSTFILLSIPGAHASTPPEAGTKTDGTGAAANVAALNPTGWDAEDTLWIAVGGSGEDATTGSFTGVTASPTNYGSDFVTSITADVVGGVNACIGFRQLNAASEDPATFTTDTSNARNSNLLIAVRPPPATQTVSGADETPGFVPLAGSPDSIRTADQPGLDITGDWEMVFCLKMPDWTPATHMVLASKWQADSAAGLSYAMRVANFSGGQVEGWWWDSNVGTLELNGITNNGGVNGSHMWIKGTLDVDNGTSNSNWSVYTSTDPITTDPASVSWTLLGASASEPVATIGVTTQPLWLGLRGGGEALVGDYYYFNLKDGIGGTIVAEMDARTADPSGTDGLGNSWSLNDTTYTAPVAGSLFVVAPSFLVGDVAGTGGQTVTGSLFTRTPVFSVGAVLPQAVTLTGVLFTRTPTFPAGAVTSNLTIPGVLFSRGPTFGTGRVDFQISGVSFTRSPIFGTGVVVAEQTVTGVLFTVAPSFGTGAVASTDQTLTGVLFTRTPTFSAGSANLAPAGALFTRPPVFGTGTVTSSLTVPGVLFSRTPIFGTGTVLPQAVTLGGVLFTRTPTFGTGRVDVQLTGVLFTRTPVFGVGQVRVTQTVAGVLFTRPPIFDAGIATQAQILAGVLFTRTPTFPTGVATSGPVTLNGVLLTRSPTFGNGAIHLILIGATFTGSPVFGVGVVAPESDEVYLMSSGGTSTGLDSGGISTGTESGSNLVGAISGGGNVRGIG